MEIRFSICFCFGGRHHLILLVSNSTDDQGPELPTRSNEEFRPFIRRLPEFKFWYATTKSTVIGMICTFFEVFNIPVFWPILVMYFITLFCITMKRQIKVSQIVKWTRRLYNSVRRNRTWVTGENKSLRSSEKRVSTHGFHCIAFSELVGLLFSSRFDYVFNFRSFLETFYQLYRKFFS